MYVPILKNRSIEVSVLQALLNIPLSEHTLPMIEIVQEKVRSNATHSFVEQLADMLAQNSFGSSLFVDVPRTNIPKRVARPVQEFLIKVNRDHGYWLDVLMSLKGVRGAIPVVSFNSASKPGSELAGQIQRLQSEFDALALRIPASEFPESIWLLDEMYLSEKDYLMLDIGSSSHTNPALQSMYKEIRQANKEIGFTAIILNSPRRKEITNVGLDDGKPIVDIDNSLRDFFTVHGFDGFGDYAGITAELPTAGGRISPAGVFYSYEENVFVGFRRHQKLAEFEDYIAPAIMSSRYWNEFRDTHHQICPGCQTISEINNGMQSGQNQAKWKGITMGHYIYAIDEELALGRE